jgi:hypothetical protein
LIGKEQKKRERLYTTSISTQRDISLGGYGLRNQQGLNSRNCGISKPQE